MMEKGNRSAQRVVSGLVIAMLSAWASAQDPAADYPNRTVRMIMPNAPGSSVDTLGRIVGARLGDVLGQQIVIENRAGAGGVIGMEMGKNAPPDGYTIVFTSASSMSSAPHLQKKVPYDPLNDFAFVSLLAILPNVLVVNTALPVRTVQELIDYARANPGKINMASAGPGAASHLGGLLLQVMGRFDSLHVPYKGGGPSVASVMAGETQWTIAPAPAAMSSVKSGKLRAIGHSMPARSPLLGDMPAVAETVPGYAYSGWAGMVAPKATPPRIVEKLRVNIIKTLAIPAVRDGITAQGGEVFSSTPEEFRQFVQQDLVETGKIVKAAGLQPE
jgi:tripartite-type tricarboxylate transporter receptor subunit TctC